MKRIGIVGLIAIIALSSFGSTAFAIERAKAKLIDTSPVHFSFSARGGMFFPTDADFRRIYGKWTNDIYFLEFGWYPFRNFHISGATGFYYEPANTIGAISGTPSDEDVYLSIIPMELGIGYRFNFAKNQIVVPYIGGGWDFFYFNEDPDPGSVTDGFKNGPSGNAGLLVLLDRFEPKYAWKLYKGFGIDNSYFDIGGKYINVGSKNGINFIGPIFYAGVLFEF